MIVCQLFSSYAINDRSMQIIIKLVIRIGGQIETSISWTIPGMNTEHIIQIILKSCLIVIVNHVSVIDVESLH